MKFVEDTLFHFVIAQTDKKIDPEDDSKFVVPWLIFALMAGAYGLMGSILTTYWGQAAMGSGVAELTGYLNGVNYPEFISIKVLVTKIVAVVLAVCGNLCVGKEGPLAHIGGVIGAATLYIPGLGVEHLHNDDEKRLYIASGAACGVSVTFGAPIGGALFVYELSRPNTFWKFQMIWKVFFACSVSVFTIAMWSGI